ncbi:late competence development ComFB family protein [Aurantivibrio plasticivorans]
MWLNTGHIYENLPSGLDSIHNYYERLVLEEIAQQSSRSIEDQDFCADVACVALNRLPPRYIRYDVDMTFFLSPVELQEIHDKVTRSVSEALEYVTSRGRRDDVKDEPIEQEDISPDRDLGEH